jgi:nucleotide-binding universal stress UspA family protein
LPREIPDGATFDLLTGAACQEDFVIMLNSVLVATDFGDTSVSALEYGRNLARTFGARLHVVHVVARVAPMSASEFEPASLLDLQADVVDDANRRLEALLTDEDRTLEVKPMVLVSTSAADAIADYARRTHVDVIVVGTHGRGGISHLLMGSVAEHVVRHAPCPVLVVRPRAHQVIAPEQVPVGAGAAA